MIGIDIEKNTRFDDWTEEGLKRVFSAEEIKYASQFANQSEHFCGFYCVKEAIVKALDDDSINFSKIEILHTETGKPYINMSPYVQLLLKEHNRHIINISISHARDYSTGIAMID